MPSTPHSLYSLQPLVTHAMFAQYTDADWKHLIATLPRSEAPA
jgi:hypothetical protein